MLSSSYCCLFMPWDLSRDLLQFQVKLFCCLSPENYIYGLALQDLITKVAHDVTWQAMRLIDYFIGCRDVPSQQS
jgi:hypothetical protein